MRALVLLRPRPPGGVTMCSRKSLSRLLALQKRGSKGYTLLSLPQPLLEDISIITLYQREQGIGTSMV